MLSASRWRTLPRALRISGSMCSFSSFGVLSRNVAPCLSLAGPTGSRHLDFERIVEAVEIVEQADDADELDELPLVIVRGYGVPHLIGNVAVAESDRVGQSKRGGFGRFEVSVESLRILECI